MTFTERPDGQVDATLGPEWPLFNEALYDAISSLPPRGAAGVGPSTYWIDIASACARQAAESGDERPFTGGNITVLRVLRGRVVASYEWYEEEHETEDQWEAISLADFLDLLQRWRDLVVASAERATETLPDTYRRNPHR